MQADVIDVRVDGRPRVRKVYSEAYKRRVVALTFEPGVSVSQVAQRHGINTNLLFSWRRQPGNAPSTSPPALLPVTVSVPDTDAKQTMPQAEAKQACWRRFLFDPARRFCFDPGVGADDVMVGCG